MTGAALRWNGTGTSMRRCGANVCLPVTIRPRQGDVKSPRPVPEDTHVRPASATRNGVEWTFGTESPLPPRTFGTESPGRVDGSGGEVGGHPVGGLVPVLGGHVHVPVVAVLEHE